MDTSKHIQSLQNPLLKKVLLLQEKSRERKKQLLFVVEGIRELKLALAGEYAIETLLYCPEILKAKEIQELANAETTTLISVTKLVYEKLAYRGSTEGVIALLKQKQHHLNDLQLGDCPLILVTQAPEKPGNLGALLRTVDAAKLDAIIIADPKTDVYNPNTIRSSVGGIFTTQIGIGSTDEVIAFLQKKKITIHCAELGTSKSYLTCDYTGPTALVVGPEANGLSDEWLTNSDQNIIIPMQGQLDSMNVSVSAAILIFEALRQRGK